MDLSHHERKYFDVTIIKSLPIQKALTMHLAFYDT